MTITLSPDTERPNIYESAVPVKSELSESEATSLLEADCRS